jgi:hypothetical protein
MRIANMVVGTAVSRVQVALGVVFMLLLAGCASPIPPGQALYGPVPPPPAGMGQLVVYRSLEYYDTQAMPVLYLNGAPAGVTQNGGVIVRNVPPGEYAIGVAPSMPYPGQFKTVVVRPGEVFYAKIGTLPSPCSNRFPGFQSDRCSGDTFIVTVVDPQTGLAEVQGLRLLRG